MDVTLSNLLWMSLTATISLYVAIYVDLFGIFMKFVDYKFQKVRKNIPFANKSFLFKTETCC